ncbi:hypothetical protein ACFE04_014821 [Oxalis oulophora]
MVRNRKSKILWLLGSKKTVKKKTIIVGLKSHYSSREMLLGLLRIVANPGDNVLALHVQLQPFLSFDPNIFHIHEDLCKTKQVDLLVQVSQLGEEDDYISVLANQVRLNNATILALGCTFSGPKDSLVSTAIKRLPPTCTLLLIDDTGRVLLQQQGTSQQGSSKPLLYSSLSSPLNHSCFHQPLTASRLNKSFTVPPSSLSKPHQTNYIIHKKPQTPIFLNQNLDGLSRHFTSQELCCATNNFSPGMLIAQGHHCRVYKAILEDGQAVAVKVLKYTHSSTSQVLRGVEILSRIKHQHIVQVIGYCDSGDLCAVVFNLLKGSLKQNLKQLNWTERMRVATGLAHAVDYLHHSCDPPIVHNQVKSSNILLSDEWQPQLSDFGAAIIQNQPQHMVANLKPLNAFVAGRYMEAENTDFDEKTDVYSYGVVLLELITGKEANDQEQENSESLVLWARSLLSSGLCEQLIDPNLEEDVDKEEMETVISVARLCLIHSASRRPTMEMILRQLRQGGIIETETEIETEKGDDDLVFGLSFRGEAEEWKNEGSDSNNGSLVMDE